MDSWPNPLIILYTITKITQLIKTQEQNLADDRERQGEEWRASPSSKSSSAGIGGRLSGTCMSHQGSVGAAIEQEETALYFARPIGSRTHSQG